MRILVIHNNYQFKGGEDIVVEQEVKLLLEHNNNVQLMLFDNEKFGEGIINKVVNFKKLFYNKKVYDQVNKVIDDFKPDVIHLHNLFYEITPYIINKIKSRGLPLVMTIHNYRLICISGVLMRKKKYACEDCINKKFTINGVFNKCFRDSYSESFVLSMVLYFNRILKTFKKVDAYFVLTEFSRNKLLNSQLNFEEEKIIIKPNFVHVENGGMGNKINGYLYVGRLSLEKGILVAIKCAIDFGINLTIIGDGPLKKDVESIVREHKNILYLGKLKHSEVLNYIKNATSIIVPSLCYEGLPTNILEAYALKTLVFCSNLGNLNSIIRDNETGVLFNVGDEKDLYSKIKLIESNTTLKEKILKNAYSEYNQKYNREYVYEILRRTYANAIKKNRK